MTVAVEVTAIRAPRLPVTRITLLRITLPRIAVPRIAIPAVTVSRRTVTGFAAAGLSAVITAARPAGRRLTRAIGLTRAVGTVVLGVGGAILREPVVWQRSVLPGRSGEVSTAHLILAGRL
jgi:hypothetical protein